MMRTRARPVTRLLLAVSLTLLLAGCADPVTAPQAGDHGARPQGPAIAEDDPGAQDDPGAPDDLNGPDSPVDPDDLNGPDAPVDPDAPLPQPCADPVVAAIGATIDAQLEAFARADFPAALAEATPGFRSGTDPEAFQRLIERDYPLLLDDASAEVEGCVQRRSDLSDVVAVVATDDGARTRFVYRLRLVEGRWGIEAAGRLDPPPATA